MFKSRIWNSVFAVRFQGRIKVCASALGEEYQAKVVFLICE